MFLGTNLSPTQWVPGAFVLRLEQSKHLVLSLKISEPTPSIPHTPSYLAQGQICIFLHPCILHTKVELPEDCADTRTRGRGVG